MGLSDGSYSEVLDGDVKEGDLVVTDVTVSGKGATPSPGGASPRALRL